MDPDPSMSLAVQLSFLFVLILINAFFAASEMAIVSVNKNRIKVLSQEGNKKATMLLKLLAEPNRFLSTIQVAITLAGFWLVLLQPLQWLMILRLFFLSSIYRIQPRLRLCLLHWSCRIFLLS